MNPYEARRLHARARADRSGTDWFSVRNATGDNGGAAEVVIYDEIGWFGTTAADFLDELKQITADRIDLRLNSPGGEIFDGIAIFNVLRHHDARVTTYVDSLAASVASVIAMAGDEIVMQPYSQMMIHDGWGLVVGNAADMNEMADLLDRQSNNIASIYAGRAGGTADEWRDRMRAETWYFADEAVAAGLADRVGAKADTGTGDGKARNAWDLSLFNYSGREKAPTPEAHAQLTDDAQATEDAHVIEEPVVTATPVTHHLGSCAAA